MPSCRASSRISRFGYMPGSWVSTPARNAAGWCALSQADWYVGSANAAACALQKPNDANARSTAHTRSTSSSRYPRARAVRVEPLAHLGLGVRRAERAAHLVRLGERAPGHDVQDLQHLLVEHHDAARLGQRRPQVRVQVLRVLPALPGPQERGHHVRLDRAGAEQRDVGDQVVERLRPELADQLALTGRLDLEAAEGVRRPDQRVRRRVVQRDRVQVDLDVVDAAHLLDRLRHRRLHADAEDVELEQAEVLDVVLVELAHREPRPARLDRRAVQQGAVGQQHAARVQRDVPGQAVEPLDEREHAVQPGRTDPAGPQLGQVGHRGPRVPRADVRERLGQRPPRPAAGRAPRRRRGSHAAPGRCPSSTRTRSARRRSGRGSARTPRYDAPTPRRRRCPAARGATVTGTAPSAGRARAGRRR